MWNLQEVLGCSRVDCDHGNASNEHNRQDNCKESICLLMEIQWPLIPAKLIWASDATTHEPAAVIFCLTSPKFGICNLSTVSLLPHNLDYSPCCCSRMLHFLLATYCFIVAEPLAHPADKHNSTSKLTLRARRGLEAISSQTVQRCERFLCGRFWYK